MTQMRKLFSAIAAIALVAPYSVSALKHYRPFRFAAASSITFGANDFGVFTEWRLRLLELLVATLLAIAAVTVALGQSGPPAAPAPQLEQQRALAEQGNARAQGYLGMYYAQHGDYAQATPWLLKAAEQGEPASQTVLAASYWIGQGVAQNYAEALRWYRKAAEQNYALAQHGLGTMYAEGNGVKRDYAEAMRWYQKAAAQNLAQAQFSIGEMYEAGWGVLPDDGKAFEWYLKAAEQGKAAAQTQVGLFYARGRGVTRDYAKGLDWLKRAAEQSDGNADALIGAMYEAGDGVTQDFRQAMTWMRRAADHGNVQALFEIGLMYEQGWGVAADLPEAKRLYQQAASQGNGAAKTRLANLKNGAQPLVVQTNNPALGAVANRCLFEVDIDSLTRNLSKAESERRHDQCMHSNWKRLFGATPFPGDQ
jgi:TPR repeat protein